MGLRKNTGYQLIKPNIASGLVVFLVALPLCLGIALASGAPPLSGIISGIIGGIVVGFLSTSHISVAGPAAGLTAIVLVAITELGSFELFLTAVFIAGVLQLLLGIFKAGGITSFIPVSVIEGMLAGIGVIIMLKELPYALGSSVGLSQFSELLASVHFGSLLVALITAVILIGWENVPKLKRIKLLPAALFAVLVSIGLNEILVSFNTSLAIPTSQLVQLPIAHSFDEMKSLLTFPNFSGFGYSVVWVTGITMAVVASIETLLSVEAADRLDKHRRITDTNQELRAQGLGNIIASLLGGLPMTAVIVRSSANANAGATHKSSSIIHGVFLLVCVLAIPHILNKIPLATLAVVLILVGYKLAKPSTIKHFWHKGLYQFIPFIATMISVVLLDLLKGVGIGLVISILFILYSNMRRNYYLSREQLENADEVSLILGEEVSFLNKAAIKKTLKNIQPNAKVTIDATHSLYIDIDVLELIEDFTNIYARENGIKVVLKGFKSDYADELLDHDSHIHIEHKRRFS